jgi:beta-barrel assembly-enhancing protease
MRKSVLIAGVPLFLLLSSTACTTQQGPLSEVQNLLADAILPPEQAAQLGQKLAQEIEGKEALHPSEALQKRAARIGERVVAAAGPMPQAYDFSFKVLQDADPLNTHEVAHVTERHVADRLATSYGVQLLGAVALGQNPGALTQIAGSLLQQGIVLKYSRTQELPADRVGLSYLEAAGYDPRAAVAMFRKLAPGGENQAPVFLSSHPAMQERTERLESLIARGAV